MCRPAKPGDTGILIRDEFAEGRNVGKRVHVKKQCACHADCWTCENIDPMWTSQTLGPFMIESHHGPGCEFCPRKKDVIVLEDPDKSETTTHEKESVS